MSEKDAGSKQKRKRSRILYEITALVVVLMILSGLATFFFISNTFNRLVNKSIDKLVEDKAKTLHAGLNYLAENEMKAMIGDVSKYTPQQLAQMAVEMSQGSSSQLLQKATARFEELAKKNVLGLKATFAVDPQNVAFISTDPDMAFKKLPEEIVFALNKARDGGKNYVYLEKGIPELGLEGACLVSFFDVSKLGSLMRGYWGVDIVSMQEAVASINDFYSSEKNRATLIIALIVGVSVILVIIITFFVLSYLIRTRITAPIDEISSAAEQVMEGDLDVKLEVREGEEFEGLKRAFMQMVESIRKYIDKSTV